MGQCNGRLESTRLVPCLSGGERGTDRGPRPRMHSEWEIAAGG